MNKNYYRNYEELQDLIALFQKANSRVNSLSVSSFFDPLVDLIIDLSTKIAFELRFENTLRQEKKNTGLVFFDENESMISGIQKQKVIHFASPNRFSPEWSNFFYDLSVLLVKLKNNWEEMATQQFVLVKETDLPKDVPRIVKRAKKIPKKKYWYYRRKALKSKR